MSIEKYPENIHLSQDVFTNNKYYKTSLFSFEYKFRMLSEYYTPLPVLPYPVHCNPNDLRK